MKLVKKHDQQRIPYYFWELPDGEQSVEFDSEYTANYWRDNYSLFFWPAADVERQHDPTKRRSKTGEVVDL